jgi:hypothetical protein
MLEPIRDGKVEIDLTQSVGNLEVEHQNVAAHGGDGS